LCDIVILAASTEMPQESRSAPDGQGAARPSYIDQITKAAALFGAIVAAGQAGTSWINGYWTQQAELQKKEKEVQLSELKAKTDLAESYIKLIIAKDTSQPYQVMLLGALSTLKDHPLQQWAKTRHEDIQKNIDAFNRAQSARSEAFQVRTEVERQRAELAADIAALSAERELNRDNIERSNQLQVLIRAKLVELDKVRVALEQVSKADDVSVRTEQTIVNPPAVLAAAIATLSQKVNAALLMVAFPESARGNIEADVAFLAAAMKEFQISDPRLAAAIIATIAVETPTFARYEEPRNRSTRRTSRSTCTRRARASALRWAMPSRATEQSSRGGATSGSPAATTTPAWPRA
jgi:hypothetical protein